MEKLAKIYGFLRGFRDDESGAVTVDWVVLTAGTLALGLAVAGAVSEGAIDLAGDISRTVEEIELPGHAGAPPPPPPPPPLQ